MAEITADNLWSPRITAYLVVGFALTLSYIAWRGVNWLGSTQLHTLMETVAATLAAIVGVIALVRFYSKKNNTILFIGAGFLGTAFLDAYHAIVTAEFFADLMPSDLPSLVPWSWIASRQLLATMLFLSWLAWLHEQKPGSEGEIDARTIYVGTAVLTIASSRFLPSHHCRAGTFPEASCTGLRISSQPCFSRRPCSVIYARACGVMMHSSTGWYWR
jgi:hypothetical protein